MGTAPHAFDPDFQEDWLHDKKESAREHALVSRLISLGSSALPPVPREHSITANYNGQFFLLNYSGGMARGGPRRARSAGRRRHPSRAGTADAARTAPSCHPLQPPAAASAPRVVETFDQVIESRRDTRNRLFDALRRARLTCWRTAPSPSPRQLASRCHRTCFSGNRF
jgi:hypothetical protein